MIKSLTNLQKTWMWKLFDVIYWVTNQYLVVNFPFKECMKVIKHHCFLLCWWYLFYYLNLLILVDITIKFKKEICTVSITLQIFYQICFKIFFVFLGNRSFVIHSNKENSLPQLLIISIKNNFMGVGRWLSGWVLHCVSMRT